MQEHTSSCCRFRRAVPYCHTTATIQTAEVLPKGGFRPRRAAHGTVHTFCVTRVLGRPVCARRLASVTDAATARAISRQTCPVRMTRCLRTIASRTLACRLVLTIWLQHHASASCRSALSACATLVQHAWLSGSSEGHMPQAHLLLSCMICRHSCASKMIQKMVGCQKCSGTP